ncbi:helix-turn-helix domain-containing protein [Kordia antarctica]|nr:helix-turn-helix domain-containing protein [Kordia antarctica]
MFIFLFLLFISCTNTNTNTDTIIVDQEDYFEIPDSLATISTKELIDSIREYRYNNPEKAKLYTNALYTNATQQKSTPDLIESYFYFGCIADIQGEYTNAISHVNKAIDLVEKDQDSVLRKLYSLRGKVYEQYGEDSKALTDFNNSLAISKKYNDISGEVISESSIAKIHRKSKQYYEALKLHKKGYKISTDSSVISDYTRNSIIMGLAETFLKIDQLDSALVYLDKGLKESILTKDGEAESYFYTYYAVFHFLKKEKDIQNSLAYLEKAEKAISNLQRKDPKRNIEVYYYMAQCYYVLKNYEASIDAIEKAFAIIYKENTKDISNSIENNHVVNNQKTIKIAETDVFIPFEYIYLVKQLVTNYKKLGDSINQTIYFNIYKELKLKNNQKHHHLSDMMYHLNEEEELETLKKLSQKELADEKKVAYLYYLLAILCIAIILGYIFFKQKEQKKKIAYAALIQKVSALEAKSNTSKEKNNTTTKKVVSITDEKAASILKGLEKFEAQEHYLDENCNLRFVAKKVKTNATYLSKIINTHKESSFNEYINNLRIQYTLKRLKSDTQFRAYSIKSIAQEVGYKSADSFTKHFKNQTSLYPSYYIKNLNKEV